MFVSHERDVEKKVLNSEELKGVSKQVLIGPAQGWENHVMRQFHLEAGGFTPRHRHDWPHINYVTGGSGTLFFAGKEEAIEKGSIAYVPSGTEHQFRADRGESVSFICIVPVEGEG